MNKCHFVFEYGGRTYVIPEGCRSGLELYISDGLHPGGFLSAILENDFVRAAGAADAENMANLPAYANYLYNHIPGNAWGSPTIVQDWMDMRRSMKGDPNVTPPP